MICLLLTVLAGLYGMAQDLVASCGFDKQLRLSSLSEGKEVLKASLPGNGWTVCWQALDQNVLHCALDNGSILVSPTKEAWLALSRG